MRYCGGSALHATKWLRKGHDLRGTGAIPIELVSLLVASLVDSEVELCMRKVKITGLRWKWARVQGEIRITNDYRTLRKPTGKETVWYVT